jgi:hypothetical protein
MRSSSASPLFPQRAVRRVHPSGEPPRGPSRRQRCRSGRATRACAGRRTVAVTEVTVHPHGAAEKKCHAGAWRRLPIPGDSEWSGMKRNPGSIPRVPWGGLWNPAPLLRLTLADSRRVPEQTSCQNAQTQTRPLYPDSCAPRWVAGDGRHRRRGHVRVTAVVTERAPPAGSTYSSLPRP